MSMASVKYFIGIQYFKVNIFGLSWPLNYFEYLKRIEHYCFMSRKINFIPLLALAQFPNVIFFVLEFGNGAFLFNRLSV
jgi:hypothetical protein